MTTFTWLHITDLHVGMAGAKYLLPNVKRRLFKDISRLDKKAEVARLDAILFTGDLTQSGRPDQFDGVTAFLQELFDELGRALPVLAVPGNHDLERPPADSPLLAAVAGWGDPAVIPDDVWTTANPLRVQLNELFGAYTHWYSKYPHRPHRSRAGWLAGDFSTTLEKDGVRIGIVGLNTTYVQLAAGDYDGKLAVHPAQLQRVCGDNGPRWLEAHDASILLTHQPPSWLHPKSRRVFTSEIHANDWFALHLCGHMHGTHASNAQENFTGTRRSWLGRSTCGLESFVVGIGEAQEQRLERSHGYAIGQLCFDAKDVTLRFWARELVARGEFDRDQSVRPEEERDNTPPESWERRRRGAVSSSLRTLLDEAARRIDRIELRAEHSQSGTVLAIDNEDLFILLPSVFASAAYQVRSTSVLATSLDFWASEHGRMVVRASTPPASNGRTASLQRLFIGRPSTDLARWVFAEQVRAGIEPHVIDPVDYKLAIRETLPVVLAHLRGLDLPDVDLELARHEPTRIAVAIYGGATPFLGFDLPTVSGTTRFAFVFEPSQALVRAVNDLLRSCFEKSQQFSPEIESAPGRKTVVLLGAHRWKRARVVREALAAELDVVLAHCAGDNETISPDLQNTVHGVLHLAEPSSGSYLRDRAAELGRRFPDGWYALGLDDYVCTTAAMLDPHALIPLRAEDSVRRKHLLRERWNRYCTNHPGSPLHAVPYEYREYADFTVAGAPVDRIGGFDADVHSFIVKPDELSASIEIHRASSVEQREQCVAKALRRLESIWLAAGAKHGISVRPRILLEAEIPRLQRPEHPSGEFSVEVLSDGGAHRILAITQKWISSDFVELGHVTPAPSFPDELRDVLAQCVETLLTELGVFVGLSHFEFIVTPELRLALVEAQVRPGGDRIMELVERAFGVSPERALFHWMAGRQVSFPLKPRRFAAVAFLRPVRPVSTYQNVELEEPDLRAVLHVDEQLRTATAWTGPSDWTDRFVSIVGEGRTPEEARQACRAGAARVFLRTADGRVGLEVAW